MTVGNVYLAYLDVWERHITYIEDDSIREKALGRPDTTTRVKVTWQVKLLDTTPELEEGERPVGDAQAQIAELEAKQNKDRPNTRTVPRLNRDIADTQQQIETLQAGGAQPGRALLAGLEAMCTTLLTPLRQRESGRMRARLEPVETEDNPCVLSSESRYRGLENHLYRIEVHRSSDNPDNKPPSFKWSRETARS